MNTATITRCVILLLALIFKFWLIAEMEITDDYNDPVHYMEQILLHGGLCYGPGTGYVGNAFYQLGLPFRTGIEIAFLLATFLLMKALFDWPTKSYLLLGLYLFVIFNPAVEELLSHLMSDQVWLVEILLGFSLLVFFARTSTKSRWLYVTLAALFLGLSTVTRSTFAPLLAVFIAWSVISFLLFSSKNKVSIPSRPV